MENMWAPWRMSYLQGDTRSDGCFFCAIGGGDCPPEAQDLVVWRGQRVYALLNRFPYANGHVMVAPYDHEGRLDRMDAAAAGELLVGVRLMIRALRQVYDPQGFNIGANLGTAAGAGVGDHLHIHVVPRWHGDTNFMTTTSGTRVIPEALGDSARHLREALASLTIDEEGQLS
jgi:ATP adenylyltransferase